MSTIKLTLFSMMLLTMFISTIGMGGCNYKRNISTLLIDSDIDYEEEQINEHLEFKPELSEQEKIEEKKRLVEEADNFNKMVIGRLNKILNSIKTNSKTIENEKESDKRYPDDDYSICTNAESLITVRILKNKNQIPLLRYSQYQDMNDWRASSNLIGDARKILNNLDNLKQNDDYVYNVTNNTIKLAVKPNIFPDKSSRNDYFRTNGGAWISDHETKGEPIDILDISKGSKEIDKFLCNRLQQESPFYKQGDHLFNQGTSDLYFSDNTVENGKKQRLAVGFEYREKYGFFGAKLKQKRLYHSGRKRNQIVAGVAKKKISDGKYRVVIYFKQEKI